ncbi:MAG: hypothetical protein QM831_42730 [Kofleriaceae bacterium]
MMKLLSLVSVLALAGACGKKDEAAGGGTAKTAEPAAAAPKAAPITINEADWVVKNLHDTSPMVNVSMKVPKDAKLEKNGNGGVDITIAPAYQLTVSAIMVSSIDEAKKSDKSLSIESSSYQNGKTVLDEPNGFIGTEQMKTEANGHTYEPETHFYYYLGTKDGAFFSVNDARPLSNFDAPGSTYSEALAKQVYGIVKGSLKAN